MGAFTTYTKKSIYYTNTGKGKPIVLLHGFLENASMWYVIAKDFSKKHQVICIDLLGHGKSGIVAKTHTMEEMASAVKEVLDTLNISSATIIGHSMGGYVALAFAEKYTKCVSHLILLNATPFADSPEKIKNRNQAIKIVQQSPKRFINAAIPNLFAEKNRNHFLNEIESLIIDALKMKSEAIIASIKGMMKRPDRVHVLLKKGFKNTIITSLEDPIISVKQLKEISAQTNSEFYTLNGGHMSTYENSKEVLKVLQKCL